MNDATALTRPPVGQPTIIGGVSRLVGVFASASHLIDRSIQRAGSAS